MEFRQLRYFQTVAEVLSFRGAAGRLCVSQPTISQQITALEDELGVRLLYRTRRQVRLTDSGRRLLGEVRDILSRIDRAVERVGRSTRGPLHRLRVAVAPGAELNILPRIVERAKVLLPGVRIVPRSMFGAEQIGSVKAGETDVGFLRWRRRDPDLHMEVIHQEPFVVALAERHPLAAAASIALEDLGAFPFVFFARKCSGEAQKDILRIMRYMAVPLEDILEGGNVRKTLKLVARGARIALLPASAQMLRMDGVTFRPAQGRLPTDDLSLCYRKDDGRDLVRRFVECVRGAFPKSK